MNRQLRSDVESIIDAFLSYHDRLVRREIDVNIFGTCYDWDKLHEAQDDYEQARSLAINAILARIVNREAVR